ncbi:uncharacterized protein LOC122508224 [Leptopilina heterotoma]|uniref:uncharacterized protein LOC122508224 n=1 Tax=Leptopilina heterotoma TaxID=63436 RepID=UPI001CA9D282|nr:uncharacterized protein LOC122508224 [Leptopilina heterotoma]
MKKHEFESDFEKLRISRSVDIRSFGEFHETLSDLVEDLINFFGFPVLITITFFFVKTIHVANVILLNVKENNFLFATNALFKIFLYFLHFFFLSSISETISSEANNTGNILHKMWIYNRPTNCQKTIRNVSQMLLQRKLTVSLHGFINLNYQFIFRILGTVTTYLIIMVQLDDYKSGKENNH